MKRPSDGLAFVLAIVLRSASPVLLWLSFPRACTLSSALRVPLSPRSPLTRGLPSPPRSAGCPVATPVVAPPQLPVAGSGDGALPLGRFCSRRRTSMRAAASSPRPLLLAPPPAPGLVACGGRRGWRQGRQPSTSRSVPSTPTRRCYPCSQPWMLDALVRANDLDAALEVFVEMPQCNVVYWKIQHLEYRESWLTLLIENFLSFYLVYPFS